MAPGEETAQHGISEAAAARIAQLESEIEERRAEISRLRGDAAQDHASDAASSLHHSLAEIISTWERMSSGRQQQQRKFHNLDSDYAVIDLDAPPSIIYTSSFDSGESRNPSPSPRTMPVEASAPVKSVGTEETDSTSRSTWESSLDEREATLEKVALSDTEIIRKMKDMLWEIVRERNVDAESSSRLQRKVQELEAENALQSDKNLVLRAECARLHDAAVAMEAKSSYQENVIGFLKADMMSLLVAKRAVERDLDAKLLNRDATIANLERSFLENVEESMKVITDLGAQNSSLEDQVEELRAEAVKLRLRSRMLEEEKEAAEEAMRTELQLLCIEKSHYDIL